MDSHGHRAENVRPKDAIMGPGGQPARSNCGMKQHKPGQARRSSGLLPWLFIESLRRSASSRRMS